MSKLGKFLGNAEEIEIKGEKMMIYPLKVKDLKLFLGKENSSPEEQLELSKIIIKNSFTNPDINKPSTTEEEKQKMLDEIPTDEEIEEMNTEAFTKLMNSINKINGFKDENADKITELRKIKTQNIQR